MGEVQSETGMHRWEKGREMRPMGSSTLWLVNTHNPDACSCFVNDTQLGNHVLEEKTRTGTNKDHFRELNCWTKLRPRGASAS